MNTGVQRSGATPPAARTATTEAVGPHPGNPFGQGKNMPELAMAHGIPYVATATVADLHDLEDKVTRAMAIHGARYIHILVTVPARVGLRPERHGEGRPAGHPDGLFPVFEAEHGEVVRASHHPPAGPGRGVPAPPGPLRAPLRRGREPGPARRHRRPPGHGRPQHRAATACSSPSAVARLMEKPFAITSRSARAWPTRPARGGSSGPSTSTGCPRAATPARPARTSSSGCTWPRTAPTRRPGARSCATTRSPPSWGGPASTPARRPATGPRSTRRWGSTPWSASWATGRSSEGWPPDPAGAGHRAAGPGRRVRAGRPVGRLPPAAPRARGRRLRVVAAARAA